MSKYFLLSALSCFFYNANAQFAGAAGTPSSNAIHQDSSIFLNWAKTCNINRGFQDISNPNLGFATQGNDTLALGKAGTNGTVSLGDGGTAILTFEPPITNGLGYDFAVFENAFLEGFLELAFVEVSSDGTNFFRFPPTSYLPNTTQIGAFDPISDPTKINNLAGKYRATFGTPFDVEELSNHPNLNINAITHLKIIDVVGSINPAYATYDQYNNPINDPFPTPFESSGFDLDAVGVIHQQAVSTNTENNPDISITLYPNPFRETIFISHNTNSNTPLTLNIYDAIGQKIAHCNITPPFQYNTNHLPNGIYVVQLIDEKGNTNVQKMNKN
jgi:molybdopterin-guanine dinucleotide biosynthesis protein